MCWPLDSVLAVFFVTQQEQEEESRILGVRMKSLLGYVAGFSSADVT